MQKSHSIKDYFYFKKDERIGFIILIIICLFFFFLPFSFSFIFQKTEQIDFSSFKEDIALFYANEEKREFAENLQLRGEIPSISYFKFNPNLATKADFIKLGLNSKVAQTLINYRNKGGKFYKKEDLKNVYGLKEADYQKLKDYVFFPKKKSFTKKGKFQKKFSKKEKEEFNFNPNTVSYEELLRLGVLAGTAKGLINYRKSGATFKKKSDLKKVYNFTEEDYKRLEMYIDLPDKIIYENNKEEKFLFKEEEKQPVYVDINTATEEEWKQLKGIGPSYAKRIVAERKKLGGFGSKSQIAEVYYFPDSIYQMIKPFLIESPITHKISINIISEEALRNHPLTSWKEAKRIIAYRKQHGNFLSMEEFKKMPVFKEDFFKRIEPYLDFSIFD